MQDPCEIRSLLLNRKNASEKRANIIESRSQTEFGNETRRPAVNFPVASTRLAAKRLGSAGLITGGLMRTLNRKRLCEIWARKNN
jgi:hypothetical protein